MRLSLKNQFKRRKPKESEMRAASKLASNVSKFLRELMEAKPADT